MESTNNMASPAFSDTSFALATPSNVAEPRSSLDRGHFIENRVEVAELIATDGAFKDEISVKIEQVLLKFTGHGMFVQEVKKRGDVHAI